MKDTGLPATQQNLLALVKEIATPATLEMIATEWDNCPPGERVNFVMDAWDTFEQNFIIVVINATNNYGLIRDILDDSGDCKEYLELWNSGKIKNWFE